MDATAETVDIASAAAVARAFEAIGPVDVLINNAGVSRHPTLGKTDPAGWSDDVSANLNGAHSCAMQCCPAWSRASAA